MKEVRIRNSSHGGFVVEKGICHAGGVAVLGGYTMPAFIVSESMRCDTMQEAKKIAEKWRRT